MRRCVAVLLLAVLAGPSQAFAEGGLAFQYTVENEGSGSVIESSDLRGFDVGEGLRLKVRLRQTSYCYLIVGEPGRYRLAFPDPEARSEAARPTEWAKLPKSTFVRLGENAAVERVFLVVSRSPVPELENAVAQNRKVSEAMALEVRDRYSPEGSVTREAEGSMVSVKYRPRKDTPSVVVEEIAVRAK
jgi:hypothetical protein